MKFKKLISSITLTTFLAFNVLPVSAQVAPPPPPPPPADSPAPPPPPPPPPPPADTPAPPPPAPTAAPPPPAPTSALPSPTVAQSPAPTESVSTTPQPETIQSSPAPEGEISSSTVSQSSSPGSGESQNGQDGGATIVTGDVNNTGMVVVDANSNLSADGSSSGSGISVANDGNGADSSNSGSVSISDNNSTTQNNTADVSNSLDQSGTTGSNSASYNTGGNNIILTGDANVSGTAITSVNTNLDGVMVAQFDIADGHQGDYVLDFAANCISGCGTASASASNTGNGADSTNNASVDQTSSDATFQNNDAAVGNTLILAADTGNNDTNANTGGNNTIATGDANVNGNALTFANNNISGSNVVFGVVNIYGDLVGDIIFPEEAFGCCGTTGASAANTGNGADSENTASVSTTQTDNTFQANQATIDNNLTLNAETGSNDTNANTGGNNLISSGDTSVNASVLNVANTNIDGGNWFLVLVNEAGQWVGRILGGPEGSNMAASEGMLLTVSPDGQITATNAGNGAGSTNTSSSTATNTTQTTQNNTANVSNNMQLSANTGGNDANYNTGGDNTIITGDAKIIANIVNFVNNNITGGGKLFVTVVNVFGSWLGDFVTPGHKKEIAQAPAPEENLAELLPAIGGSDPLINPVFVENTSPEEKEKSVPPTIAASVRKLTAQTTSFSAVSELTGISPQVAGFISDDLSGSETLGLADTRKVLSINLAWLLLILPAVGILWSIKLRRVIPARK